MKFPTVPISIAAALLLTPVAAGQSFALDDNPSAPATAPIPGPIPGFGAENPFGIAPIPGFPPGYAPSPTLPALPCFDSDILAPSPLGPVVNAISFNGFYEDSVSDNAVLVFPPVQLVQYRFSVDRLARGIPPSAVNTQWGFTQQAADVFLTTDWFNDPGMYVGVMFPTGGFGGPLMPMPHVPGPAMPSNTLLMDDSFFQLLSGDFDGDGINDVVPPMVPAGLLGLGTHDNIDQFDRQLMDTTGDQVNDVWQFFTIYPDEAMMVGVSPADIFDLPPGPVAPPWTWPPYAPAGQMGLLNFFPEEMDSIDALVMFDHGAPGGQVWGGPGAEPALDYALFSLSPGSPSLPFYGLSAGDVFFTDFRGTFWLYATAAQLGLNGVPGGAIGDDDNVDGLEIRPPCPADVDGDDQVGFSDLLAIIGAWGTGGPVGDVNGDGTVDFADILAAIAAWGPCA